MCILTPRQNLFSFGPAAELAIALDGAETRATIRHPAEKAKQIPLFREEELVRGTLKVVVPDGKRLEHTGVKIEMIGVIEMPHERQSSYEFTSLVRELESAGAIDQEKTYAFDFSSVEKPHESYYGRSVRLRYYIRATVTRSYASNVVQEQDLWVQVLGTPPPMNNTIKMEVGIEDCLHIEFEYDKSKYVSHHHLSFFCNGAVVQYLKGLACLPRTGTT